jgi:hypothetical protein
MLRGGQQPTGEVDGPGHGQSDERRPGQGPAFVAGPDQQRQQRPHDQVGDDPPVAPGDSETDHGRHLAGQGNDEP